jgi:hypothetical protein
MQAWTMPIIQVRSQVSTDGSITVQLPESLANQEVELILSYQPVQEVTLSDPDTDPLIGLFTGSHNLATDSESILEREIAPRTGWSWKQQSLTPDSLSP